MCPNTGAAAQYARVAYIGEQRQADTADHLGLTLQTIRTSISPATFWKLLSRVINGAFK